MALFSDMKCSGGDITWRLSGKQSVGVQVSSDAGVVDQTRVSPGVRPLDGGRLIVPVFVPIGAVLGRPECACV